MRKVSFTQKSKKEKNKKKGFTLVELIIVIAVIALLAAMAIPKFSAIRTEAKVSNDIAAAKNIHTITATLLANGTWTPTEANGKTSADGEITKRLDGKIASDGKAEACDKVFDIAVDSSENITIKCNGKQLYPEKEGERKAYLATVTGTTTTP
jgi:type IV pilus assembly protein PilA